MSTDPKPPTSLWANKASPGRAFIVAFLIGGTMFGVVLGSIGYMFNLNRPTTIIEIVWPFISQGLTCGLIAGLLAAAATYMRNRKK